MHVCARGSDGAVWHRWQTAPSNGWSDWYSLGGWVDLIKVVDLTIDLSLGTLAAKSLYGPTPTAG